MKLWVGLGNPGSAMRGNRHNIGFMAVDAIQALEPSFTPWRARFRGLASEGRFGGVRILLLKPATYMNLSGESVQQGAAFYKIPVEDITVFHDELDLDFGRMKVKTGGGAAGHNGLRSMDKMLGVQNYQRVRMGIGHPGARERVTGHVLGDFNSAERPPLEAWLDAVARAAPLLAAGDGSAFMSKVSLLRS
ncbi:aminoacyl-tRNA hydrolase [Formicincola oecophyllae]|uniref:Peptidyl-tRNA hydrolase n=1 Tax=Formicincola oecophyllae TaxID=2558361 RepID=A0A4Y6UAJ1_9PROT|nr:aminoacyl-tRNA hydrolase [Formicincola oecophyllae]QDH13476.1 aminoacyl-tRNA hydrolase [Formicincola oecophyllae]